MKAGSRSHTKTIRYHHPTRDTEMTILASSRFKHKRLHHASCFILVVLLLSCQCLFAQSQPVTTEDGPSIQQVIPSKVVQGKTYDIAITGHWTHFRQEATKLDFGPGIKVNVVTVLDDTNATANITVSADAAPGDRNLSVQTRKDRQVLKQALQVESAASLATSPASDQNTAASTAALQGAPETTAKTSVKTEGVNKKAETNPAESQAAQSAGSQSSASQAQVPQIPSGAPPNQPGPEGPGQISLSPSAGAVGDKLQVTITGTGTHFVQGQTVAKFGAGIGVGNSPAGGFGQVTVTSPTSATAEITIYVNAPRRDPVNVFVRTGSETATLQKGFTVNAPPPAPSISSFTPGSAPVGTLVNVSGNNFIGLYGARPQVTLQKQGGGTIPASVSSFTNSTLSFVIPTGAATGVINVTAGRQSGNSSQSLTITTPSSYTVSLNPNPLSVIQGQNASYSISLNSNDGFNQLASLDVSGIPKGMTYAFSPARITAGQISVLTVTAANDQQLGTSPITVSASANIAGQDVVQTAKSNLQVVAVTTSFLGRTVVDDYVRTPISGVTIKFLGQDGSGHNTDCSAQTVSDEAGNFSLTNLPQGCTGPQLIGYDGSTATHPEGQYAGVNLSYTLTKDQVTASPVLVHLPRIDNTETVQVQQNAPNDQYFTFQSIPGMFVTVYAGTTFKLEDNSTPDPFPLTAINVPVDRLPDPMPKSDKLMPFIVAFQPANAVASQPVAVNYPNTLGGAAGSSVSLMTLDPTRGYMVPYGNGTISADGSRIIADPDPDHPGHAYGLVHFDWHGNTIDPPPDTSPSPCGGGGDGCGGTKCDPPT